MENRWPVRAMPAATQGSGTAFFPNRSDRSLASSVGTYMDRQTKRELWILAIGTILFEAPFLAVAALALAGH
jgi:hypothetical protein